jgi:predicted secreted protein
MFHIKSLRGALALAVALMMHSGNEAEAQKRRAPRPPEAVVVREDADGQRVPLYAGDTLIIRLRSDSRTGYRWEWLETDPRVLRRERFPAIENDSAFQGYQEFQLTALRPGKATVELALEDPKRSDASPLKSFRFEVRVVPQSERPPDYSSTFTRVRRTLNRPFTLYSGEDFMSAWSAGRFWGNRPTDSGDFGPPAGPGGMVITRF